MGGCSGGGPAMDKLPLTLEIRALVGILTLGGNKSSFSTSSCVPLFTSVVRGNFRPLGSAFIRRSLCTVCRVGRRVTLLPRRRGGIVMRRVGSGELGKRSRSGLGMRLRETVAENGLRIRSSLGRTGRRLSTSGGRARERGGEKSTACGILHGAVRARMVSGCEGHF